MMMRLVCKKNQIVLCENLEVANTFHKRFLGLLLRPCPQDGEGMIFFNCSAIHMFFMRYSIDVLFLDMNGVVLKIAAMLKPWRLASCLQAKTVIEVAPGFCAKKNICIGDHLELV